MKEWIIIVEAKEEFIHQHDAMLTSCKGINKYVKYNSCWFCLAYEKTCMLLCVCLEQALWPSFNTVAELADFNA
jgi:hypothetical protein